MEFMFTVPIFYIISFILSLYFVISGKKDFSSTSNYFFISAFLIQAVLIASERIQYTSRDIETVLFLIAFIISLGSYLLIRPRIDNLYSLYVSPVAFIATIPILFYSNNLENITANNNLLVFSHVVPNLLAHTMLLIATIFSSMFLFQYKNIKNKNIKKISRLPSISLIEKINFLLIVSSFPLMSIGLGLGFVLSKKQIGSYWFGTVSSLSVTSWSIFFILIILKSVYKISAYKTSLLTIVGFITIILGYVFMHLLELPSHNLLG